METDYIIDKEYNYIAKLKKKIISILRVIIISF